MRKRANDFVRTLLAWYRRQRRELPWRASRGAPAGTLPPPYHVLVSEAMLQQTQVCTVVSYFRRFVERFPTLSVLADSTELEVLRYWQGLGYYSRARNLLGTAKIVQERYAGQIPSDVDELMSLPGIGRYTAGAIASLAFDKPAAILDGNVARVLCRLDGIVDDPREPAIREKLWQRAAQILPARGCGDFNSALMELGATVCTPRCPQCAACPVRRHCRALAAGVQEQIPQAARRKPRPVERRWTFCIQRGSKWLIEQRPPKGRWAGMWQFVTRPAQSGRPELEEVCAHTGVAISCLRPIGRVSHELTHRRYRFQVFLCQAERRPVARLSTADGAARAWTTLAGLSAYPLPRPHAKMAEMLRACRL